jgi:hypothetical protein
MTYLAKFTLEEEVVTMSRNTRNQVLRDMASYSRRRHPQIRSKLYLYHRNWPCCPCSALGYPPWTGGSMPRQTGTENVFPWAEWITLGVIIRNNWLWKKQRKHVKLGRRRQRRFPLSPTKPGRRSPSLHS